MAEKHVLVINEKDNVGVVMDEVFAKDSLVIAVGNNKYTIEAREFISRLHKVAVTDIMKDAKVLKYGETIGIAQRDILSGEHVHIHNLKGLRG